MLTSYQTHEDIMRLLASDIEQFFEENGAIAPAPTELYPSERWRYCRTEDKKSRGKIGFLCRFERYQDQPVVKLVINNFRHGGQTAIFNSFTHQKSKQRPILEDSASKKRLILQKQVQQQNEQQETLRRQKLYEKTLLEWQNGNQQVTQHQYISTKRITQTQDLKLISRNRLAYPLYNIEGEITALQTIDAEGSKRIYGRKKGSFGVLGNLESAKRLYLCEGYSTASAIYNLILLNQKRRSPFAAIIGVDNRNLETVARILKKDYSEKKLIVCPDNDVDKLQKELPNAGLLSGYQAAIENYLELKIPPNNTPGSDWCDAWLADPEQAVLDFSETKKIRLLDYTVEILHCFKPNDFSIQLKKQVVRALNTAAQFYPSRLQEDDFLPKILSATQHTQLKTQTIQTWWSRIKRRQFGMALRARSIKRQQDSSVTMLSVSTLSVLPKTVEKLKKKHPKAIFITNAEMGTGKTKLFMQPEFKNAEDAGLIPVIITPVRSLTKGVSERFQSSHYIDDTMHSFENGKETIPASLAITINSIIQKKFQTVLTFSRSLFVDEYTQVLRAITTGTVENHQRQQTEQRLAALIQQAQYTYIADADFNQIALDHLKEIVADDCPIFLFTVQRGQAKTPKSQKKPSSTKIIYRYHSEADPNFSSKHLIQQILDKARDGKRLYVAADSKTQLTHLETVFEEEGIEVLSVTANTINFKAQQQFVNNPNYYLTQQQPQVVLVSPAIQSGVSIEVNYFDYCFGVYTGVVSPIVFQQMLHRIRTNAVFDLCLPNYRKQPSKSIENSTALLVAAYQQHLQQFGGSPQITFDPKTQCHTIGQLKIKQEKGQLVIEGDEAYQRYEKLCAELQALDNQQRNHAANFLLLQAKARQITLKPVQHTLEQSDKLAIKNHYEKVKETIYAEQIETLTGLNTLSKEDAQLKKQKGGAQTPEEFAKLKRFEIAEDLGISEVTEKDIDFHNQQGHRYVANFIALKKGEQHAQKNDEHDHTQGVAKTNARWRANKVRLLAALFACLEINPITGQGGYHKTQAKKLRQLIREDETLTRYLTFQLKLNIDSHLHDVAFANKILKKLLGLSAIRTQVREEELRYWVYSINEESFARLKHYIGFKEAQENNNIFDLSPGMVI